MLFQAMPGMCGHHAQNLLILRSLQFSWICAGDMHFSCLEAKVAHLSQSKHWSTGCQICQTCSATPAMYMYIAVLFRIIMCLVTQWQQIVPAFICLSNLFHCFSNTLLFTCSTASSGRHTLVHPFTLELTMYKRMHEFILDSEVAYGN